MTHRQNSQGFTIIELLIASTVFSVVLLLVLQGVMHIGRLYYKGLSAARTQALGRRLSDEFTQALQFGGSGVQADALVSPPSGGSSAIFCVGSYRYKVTFNRQLDPVATGSRQSTQVLLRQVRNDVTVCSTTDPFDAPTELMDKGMRIVKMQILPVASRSGLYTVSLRIIAGDDDLLNYSNPAAADQPAIYQTATCRDSSVGGQFCADSSLSSTVERRVGI